MVQLGVNIDHIATLRNARGDFFPSLAYAAGIVEGAGGDFITIHVREDRRHINEEDLYLLKSTITTSLNLEMACNEDVLQHALKALPQKVTLVPEKREEVTTEGGLNIVDINQKQKIKEYTQMLQEKGIIVSLFIEPDMQIIEHALDIGAEEVEIHTGHYSTAKPDEQKKILHEIAMFAKEAHKAKLRVCAGHGLTYHNVQPLLRIKAIEEYNIGYAIITQSLFVGLDAAVREMKRLIKEGELLCKE